MKYAPGGIPSLRRNAATNALVLSYSAWMIDLPLLRLRLLELHERLLDAERVTYEREHGRMSANAFLQALTSDPSFSWLAPLNAAIVQLDELLDLHAASSDGAAALADHLTALRTLLALDERTDLFGARYRALLDAHPEVAFAHGAFWSVLRA